MTTEKTPAQILGNFIYEKGELSPEYVKIYKEHFNYSHSAAINRARFIIRWALSLEDEGHDLGSDEAVRSFSSLFFSGTMSMVMRRQLQYFFTDVIDEARY